MTDYNNDSLMKWILNGAKNFIDKEKTLIPNKEKMNQFLDTYNKINALCKENGYEFSLDTEHSKISPCDIILSLKMDYFGIPELKMDEFRKSVNEILSSVKSFDVSSSDGCYIITMMFDVYIVEIVDIIV